MSLQERINKAQCIGCREGVHDPRKLYPCLDQAEWERRERLIRRRAKDMTYA